MRMWQAYRATR